MSDMKWRVLVAGVGVLLMSLMARLEWSTPPILAAWILGYLTFPLLWGYPKFSDEEGGK